MLDERTSLALDPLRPGAAGRPEEQPRNPGMPLELGWLRDVHVNRSAVERRAATLMVDRSV